MDVISPETRMMGLPCGEEIMIVGRTMCTQSTSVTDGRTDKQADRITITNTVQRIASHGKNPGYGRDQYARAVKNVNIFRPPGTTVPDGLIFCPRCF